MNKEEAHEAYRRQTELLMTLRVPGDEPSMPAMSIRDELEHMVAALKDKNGAFKKDATVEKALTDEDMLVLALTAPTTVTWSESSGETERDPVSGNQRSKKARHHEGTPLSPVLYDIKHNFVACARAMTGYAKRIASPTFDAWHDIYFTLEAHAAKNGLLIPMDGEFARAIVSRFSEALFALWVDNEIEKEVRHV